MNRIERSCQQTKGFDNRHHPPSPSQAAPTPSLCDDQLSASVPLACNSSTILASGLLLPDKVCSAPTSSPETSPGRQQESFDSAITRARPTCCVMKY